MNTQASLQTTVKKTTTGVGDFINTMKTTFDLYQAFKKHGTHKLNIEVKRSGQFKKILFDYL